MLCFAFCLFNCSLYKNRNSCYLKPFSEMPKYSMFFFCLNLWSLSGVFGVDSVKSVTEGESVSLNSDLTEIQRDDEITWKFNNIMIARINVKDNTSKFYEDNADGRFRDRLKLDQTGSLIITNTRTTDSGEYKVNIKSSGIPLNIFRLTVYVPVPVPVITRDSPQSSSSSSSSSSYCLLLCSVVNVGHVTLSWYKGNSLLSSIYVSDLSRSLSLHLECLDDFYSCVVNNPISNQTQHLNNTELCQPCSDHCICCCGFTEAVIRLALSALVGVAAVAVLVYDIRSRTLQHEQT